MLYRTSRCGILGDQLKIRTEYQERRKGKGDLTLTVDEGSSKAHRSVLMEKSDYFRSMLSGHFLPGHSPESDKSRIDLSHCFSKVRELNMVLDFMYTGNVFLSKEKISCVLNAASLFRLTELESACSEFLMANLAPCTCISIFILAEKYSLKKVQHGCLEIFKTWFPFYLCHVKEALEIPPDCMKVMVEENVFELISEDVRVTFLKKWCEHLGESAGGMVPVPEEVQRLIQNVNSPGPAEDSAGTKTPKEDEMQEVFMAIFYPEGSGQIIQRNDLGPDVRSIEILAFSPKLKTWKSLLRHTFSEPIHPKLIDSLIGLTETKAFFVLRSESKRECESHGGESCMERCIVSVDLESGTECLITVPYESFTSYSPTCFLWGTDLYGFFLIKDECCWSLFKNQHDSECDGNCKGKCWKYVCDLTIDRPEVGGDSIIAKAFGNDVFIGLENWEVTEELLFFHMYKTAAGKCRIVELAPWGRFEDFQFEKCALFSCIYVDYEKSLVKFVLKLDAGECISDFVYFPDLFHNQYTCTYDVAGKKWKDKEVEKVVYPKELPKVLEVTRKYPKELPKVLEVTRKIRKVDSPVDDFLEEASVHWYFARSTSPYNSSIWRAGEDGKLELVTHAPCALSTIARMTTGELPTGFLSEMPNATIKDFSGDLGQSALTTLVVEEDEVDFQISFKAKKNEKLLNLRKWENASAELWEENLESEETDCLEIIPEVVNSS